MAMANLIPICFQACRKISPEVLFLAVVLFSLQAHSAENTELTPAKTKLVSNRGDNKVNDSPHHKTDANVDNIFGLSKKKRQNLRIIALAPHIVESLFEVGAGQQIIATTAHADYPEAAKDIPQIGNYARLQIEKIIQLQPDLVIAWKTGNPGDDLARLKKYHTKVVYSNPKTLADVADELIMLGQLTGREDTAKKAASQYQQKLTALKKRYSDKTPVITFYELWSRPLRTVANNAWPQQQLGLCGAHNPFVNANTDYPSVGLEQVLITLPQVIIQPSKHAADSPDSINWSQWQHIPGAKNNFIFHPDADKVHRMTSRMLDEVALMCEQIDVARQFYRRTSSAQKRE
jgi:vitamin B12 transport system substrate-binding protein